MTLVEVAQECAQQGWHVFPCAPGDKTPMWKWGTQATTNLATIVAWWTAHPDHNVAIACKPSKLAIVDLDIAKVPVNVLGEDFRDGRLALEHVYQTVLQWNPDAETYATYIVQTPSGGNHLYYRDPDNAVGNRPLCGAAGLMDVRASGGEFGGYVLAAGSVNRYGQPYSAPRLQTSCVQHLPPWLEAILTTKKPSLAPPRDHFDQPDDGEALAEWLALVPPGNRNNATMWCAARLFEKGLSLDQVREVLLPSVPDLGDAAERTILSAKRTVEGD